MHLRPAPLLWPSLCLSLACGPLLGADFSTSSGVADGAAPGAQSGADARPPGDASADGDTLARADVGAPRDARPDTDGETADASLVFDTAGVPKMALGFGTSCAIKGDQSLWCWGNGVEGATGHGLNRRQLQPTAVQGVTDAVQVATDVGLSCAVTSTSRVMCFGTNAHGELGLGTTTSSDGRAHAVEALTDVAEVAVGRGFACALSAADGSVFCWGDNRKGQLGRGTLSEMETFPDAVVGMPRATHIVAREATACAVRFDQKVFCWGGGVLGELGIGTLPTRPVATPTEVDGLGPVQDVALNGLGGCALLPTGQIRCWGRNQFGEVGSGTASTQPVLTPTPVAGLVAKGIAAVSEAHCAHLQDDSVRCWGHNFEGFLHVADGSTSVLQPSLLTGLPNGRTKIYGGFFHLCANMQDGSLQCWGSNSSGQLGLGTAGVVPVAPSPVAAF